MATTQTAQYDKLILRAQEKCATLKVSGSAYRAWLNVSHALTLATIEDAIEQLQTLATSPIVPTSRKAIYNRAIRLLTKESEN